MTRRMDIELILTPGLGNGAFLVSGGREAIVIDPPRDAWRVMAAAEQRGWRITHVLETHVHNDYLSGALELRAALRCGDPRARSGTLCASRIARCDDGDVLDLDDLGVRRASHPRPHTGASGLGGAAPMATGGRRRSLTGGSLLVGSAGRTDLLGDRADRSPDPRPVPHPPCPGSPAATTWRSCRRMAPAASARWARPDAARTTTIGQERRSNPLLAIDDGSGLSDDAARWPRRRTRPTTPRWRRSTAAGPRRRSVESRCRAEIGPAAVREPPSQAGRTSSTRRSRRVFAAGHIAGSLNIELEESFSLLLGWFVPFGAPVVLVLPRPVGRRGSSRLRPSSSGSVTSGSSASSAVG